MIPIGVCSATFLGSVLGARIPQVPSQVPLVVLIPLVKKQWPRCKSDFKRSKIRMQYSDNMLVRSTLDTSKWDAGSSSPLAENVFPTTWITEYFAVALYSFKYIFIRQKGTFNIYGEGKVGSSKKRSEHE